MSLRSLIILILVGASLSVSAQRRHRGSDTAIKGATIEIIQSYKPEVKQAPKPQLSPDIPPADTARPALTYEVPQQTLSYTYTSFPLRPLALGTDSVIVPYANYAKLGIGNLSTLLGDVYIGSLRGHASETNLHLHHFSQKGSIANQQTAQTGLEANGIMHRDGNEWRGGIEVFRNRYGLYGYDHSQYEYSGDSVKQVFTGFHLNVSMKNEEEGFKGLDYNPSIGLSLYGDHFDANERTFLFDIPVSYTVDTSLQLKFGINAALTQFNSPTVDGRGNNAFQITPVVSYRSGNFEGFAGLYPTFATSGTYILPDLRARYKLTGTGITIIGGWQSLLHRNTFEELTTRNPYMSNAYDLKQMRSTQVYGGVTTNIGNHISFTGKLSWWQYSDMPLFINDTVGDGKQFLVAYDPKVNAFSVEASIRYQVANTFAIGLSGSWYNYYNKTFTEVWHEPAIRFKGDVLVRPLPGLTVTAYLSLMDEIYALRKGGGADRLPATFDLGGAAEYNFTPRISAFIEVNNLLNNNYQRWAGYDAYGFNIFGGIRFKF